MATYVQASMLVSDEVLWYTVAASGGDCSIHIVLALVTRAWIGVSGKG